MENLMFKIEDSDTQNMYSERRIVIPPSSTGFGQPANFVDIYEPFNWFCILDGGQPGLQSEALRFTVGENVRECSLFSPAGRAISFPVVYRRLRIKNPTVSSQTITLAMGIGEMRDFGTNNRGTITAALTSQNFTINSLTGVHFGASYYDDTSTCLFSMGGESNNCRLYNDGSNVAYLGNDTSVTPANGYILYPGQEFKIENTVADIYGICDPGITTNMRYWIDTYF